MDLQDAFFFGAAIKLWQTTREFFASGVIFSISLTSARRSTSWMYLRSLSDIQRLTTFDDYRAGPDPGNQFWVKIKEALNGGEHGLKGISNNSKIGDALEGTLGMSAAAALYRLAVTGKLSIVNRNLLAARLKDVF